MTEDISEAEYRQHREEQAALLLKHAREDVNAGRFETVEDGVMHLAKAVLDTPWFDTPEYGPRAHGAIIEHAEADPSVYNDWASMMEAPTPEATLGRLAYCVYEADVIAAALARDEEEREAEA